MQQQPIFICAIAFFSRSSREKLYRLYGNESNFIRCNFLLHFEGLWVFYNFFLYSTLCTCFMLINLWIDQGAATGSDARTSFAIQILSCSWNVFEHFDVMIIRYNGGKSIYSKCILMYLRAERKYLLKMREDLLGWSKKEKFCSIFEKFTKIILKKMKFNKTWFMLLKKFIPSLCNFARKFIRKIPQKIDKSS